MVGKMAEHIAKRKDKSTTPEYSEGWKRIWGVNDEGKNKDDNNPGRRQGKRNNSR
jgi:hypothetical protein